MDLILWRHAEAVDLDQVGEDMLRHLSPLGEKQASRMAAWLEQRLPDGATVLTSPAVRAERTAAALKRQHTVHPSLSPLATAEHILELVQWPHGDACTLVIGHQPALGQVIAGLTGLGARECALRTGALCWLRYRASDGAGRAVVLAVQAADRL